MTAQDLVELLDLFEEEGIEVWLDGGWAVDALLGTQSRQHKDVDILVRTSDVPAIMNLLGNRDFRIQSRSTESNFVLADENGHEIDIHVIDFDDDGNGVYRMADGSNWIFTARGLAGEGVIEGREVKCLSAETQVQCHAQGYTPQEKDLQDMSLLQKRFGLELPPNLQKKG
jgi:lincosamide nucleotidyltransferase A/C/D/E